jgi:hypothetical protein
VGESFGRGAYQGLTLNWGDELSGLKSTSGIDDGGQTLGVVPAIVGRPRCSARTPAKLIGRALPAAGNLAIQGAAYGAIAGAGGGDGDLADRAAGALKGAAYGATLATAFGAGFSLAGRVGGAVVNRAKALAGELGDLFRSGKGDTFPTGDQPSPTYRPNAPPRPFEGDAPTGQRPTAPTDSIGAQPDEARDPATPQARPVADDPFVLGESSPTKAVVVGDIRGKAADADAGATTDRAKLHLHLIYPSHWTGTQRALAEAKAQSLNDAAHTVTSVVKRSSGSANKRFRDSGGIVGQAEDVDHIIELQLGGSDTLENMRPIDRSVNRSFGAQIRHRIKNVPIGTPVKNVTIGDR